MIVCEQTRLRAVVLVGCFIKDSLGSLAFSVHQKSAFITGSIDPDWHRIQCFALLHRSEVMILTRCALFFAFS